MRILNSYSHERTDIFFFVGRFSFRGTFLVVSFYSAQRFQVSRSLFLFAFLATSKAIFFLHNFFDLRRIQISAPAGIYLLKVNNRHNRTRCEICSKLIIKIPERRQWRRSGIFIVNFEHISHLFLVFLLLTLNM